MVGKFTKIRLILTAILAFITAAVLSFAVFAATNVRLTGSGGLEYEASGEQPPDPVTPPTDEEAEKQEERLTNAGFVFADGKIDQLENNAVIGYSKDPKEMNYALRAVKEENGQLVPTGEKPILSFAIYDGAVCDYVNELVIILDFSSFYITTFGEYFMGGLVYAICGAPDTAGWRFNYSVDVPVYDAITGAQKEQDGSPVTKTVAFNGKGFDIEGESVADYSGFSLRLVLPNVKSDDGAAVAVTFEDDSLNLQNWRDVLGSYPGNIAIDLSFMDLDREGGADVAGIDFSNNATGQMWNGQASVPTVTHFHFIGKTENQLEYAFNNAIEYVGGNNAPEGYTTEIFVKESLSSPFTRLYTRVLKNAGKAEIVVVDSAATDGQSDRDILAILELCYWFKYEKQEQNVDGKYLISHQRRLSDNTLDGERARVAVSWNTAVEVAGVTAYEVRCEHNAEGLIGYFTADRTFFGADGRPISR